MKKYHSLVFGFSLLTLSLCGSPLEDEFATIHEEEIAVDWDRSAPKEAKKPGKHPGTIQEKDLPAVTGSNREIIPELKGVIITTNDQSEGDVRGVAFKDIHVPGNTLMITNYLQKNFIGKALTERDLSLIKRYLILYYRDNGRPVVSVKIPEQDITEGVLLVMVKEAKLGKVICKGNEHFKSRYLANAIRLKPGEVIDSQILAQDLTWLNRNTFRQSDVIFTPGDVVGVTDIELVTLDRRPYRIYAGVDNTGFKDTETPRLFSGVNFGNLWDLSHMFSYQYSTSPDWKSFYAHTGNYVIPLPNRHFLLLYGGFSRVHSPIPITPAEQLLDMANKGQSVQASARYEMPFKPGSSFLQEFTFGYDYKQTNNNVVFGGSSLFKQRVNLTQFVLGYDCGYKNTWVKVSATAELFFSPYRWLPNQSNKTFDKIRQYSHNTYWYVRGAVDSVFLLPKNFTIAPVFRWQVANSNLQPSEEYGIGGYNTVRGYLERLFNGDDAINFNLEARFPPVSILYPLMKKRVNDQFQFLLFFDFAWADQHKTPDNQKKDEWLAGVGPGIRYDLNRYLTSRLDWGIKLHQVSGDHPFSRLHFSVVMSY
ncbi:MAG: ShlB/FhaC/HecB family hemolysin secretion/activation protein [Chlamydiia bacterium]|nr:ShlB/FhaC/HecB family hemolysin secretion/activation protein [Chlamydiia bacterium]